jgi:hypothetical protein
MFCWLFKFTISHACDSGQPLWTLTKQHLKKCGECREFYNFCLFMDKELPAVAEPAREAYFVKRISNAASRFPLPASRRMPVAIAAVIALIILLSGIYSFLNNQGTKTPVNQKDLNLASVTNELAGLFATGVEWTKAEGVFENPIKAELQSIATDTESAARFLFECVAVDITATSAKRQE